MKNLHGVSPKKPQMNEFVPNSQPSQPIKIVDQQLAGQVQFNNLKFLNQLFSQTDKKANSETRIQKLKKSTEDCVLNLSSYKKQHTQTSSQKKGIISNSCLEIAQKAQTLTTTYRAEVDKKEKINLQFKKIIQKPSQESLLQTSKRISQLFQSINNQTQNDDILSTSQVKSIYSKIRRDSDSKVLISAEKSADKNRRKNEGSQSHKVQGWLNMDVKERSKKWIENRQSNIQKLMEDLAKKERTNCPFKPTFFNSNSSTQLSIQRMQSSVFSKKLSTKMGSPLTEQLMISSIKREDNSQNVRTSKTSVNQYVNSSSELKSNDSFYRSVKLASNSYKSLNQVRRIQNQNDGYLGCKSLINIGKANIF